MSFFSLCVLYESVLKEVSLRALETYYKPEFEKYKTLNKNSKEVPQTLSFEEFINRFFEIDPTKSKEYVRWLITCFFKNSLKFEDADKIKSYLTTFHSQKARLEPNKRDILKYQSPSELFLMLKERGLLGLETSSLNMGELKKVELEGHIEKIGESNEWLGYKLLDFEGSRTLGKDTEWCTAKYENDDARNMFYHYFNEGPLYTFLRKTSKKPKKVQIHLESDQFMDENDKEEVIENFPEIIEILKNKLGFIVRFATKEELKNWVKKGNSLKDKILPKNLEGINFEKANLEKTNFSEANLQGANLRGASVQGANFIGTDLTKADLSGANLEKVDFFEANLQGANLQGANLQGANLSSAVLFKTNLQKADLEEADLQKADLEEADLEEADLEEADLRGANLSSAVLFKTNLQGANLQGANLQGAYLKGAKININTHFPEGFDWKSAGCIVVE